MASKTVPAVFAALGLVGALGLLATDAAATEVQGDLELPRDYTPPAAEEQVSDAFYWQEWNGVLEPKERSLDAPRELAVVLVGESEGGAPDSSFHLRGGALMPSTMVAQAGTTLRIENTDGCAHELYAEGIEGFSPLQTAPGNARTLALPSEAGSWTIRDRIYPHVHGNLHVVPNLVARAELDEGGRYLFPDVAPGTYTLKVFHRDREVHSASVEIPDRRQFGLDPVSLDLSPTSE